MPVESSTQTYMLSGGFHAGFRNDENSAETTICILLIVYKGTLPEV